MTAKLLPLAAMEKIMKQCGADRVSDKAKVALKAVLEEKAEEKDDLDDLDDLNSICSDDLSVFEDIESFQPKKEYPIADYIKSMRWKKN